MALRGFLAVTALLGHLAGVVHASAAHHVTCPEHGDLLDVSEETAGAHPESAPVTPGWRGQATFGQHEHDECVVASFRGSLSAAASVPQADAPKVVFVDSGARPNGVPRPASVELYRLAPKSSPPV